MSKTKKLTKAEEEIMHMLWEAGPNTVSQLIEKMPEPKPPHSTISSFLRILEKKEFVRHKAFGRTYEYSPVVTMEEYSRYSLKNLVSKYFKGSMNELLSFMVKKNDLSIKEISELIDDLESENNDT